jgi:hypothetical protein
MFRTRVPEATVDEDRDPRLRERNVRSAPETRDRRVVDPEAQAAPVELAPERQLGSGVAASVGASSRASPS